MNITDFVNYKLMFEGKSKYRIGASIIHLFPEFLEEYEKYITNHRKTYFNVIGNNENNEYSEYIKMKMDKLKTFLAELPQKEYPKVLSSKKYYDDFTVAINSSKTEGCFFEIRTIKMSEDTEVEFWIFSSNHQYKLLNTILIDKNVMQFKNILLEIEKNNCDLCQFIIDLIKVNNYPKVDFLSSIPIQFDTIRNPIINKNDTDLLHINSKIITCNNKIFYHYEVLIILYQIVVSHIAKQPGVIINNNGKYVSLPHPMDKGCINKTFMEEFLTEFTGEKLFSLELNKNELRDTLKLIHHIYPFMGNVPYEIGNEEKAYEDKKTAENDNAPVYAHGAKIMNYFEKYGKFYKRGFIFKPLLYGQSFRRYSSNRQLIIQLRPQARLMFSIDELYFKIMTIMFLLVYPGAMCEPLVYEDIRICIALYGPCTVSNLFGTVSISFLADKKKEYDIYLNLIIQIFAINRKFSDYITIVCNKCKGYIDNESAKGALKEFLDSPVCTCEDELPYEEYEKKKWYENMKENFGEEFANKLLKINN